MGCPFHNTDESSERERDSSSERRGLGRRSFLKSAVAIGGVSALTSAARAETGDSDYSSMAYPQGDPSNRPERQHLWSPVGRTDEFGNPAPPAHQLVLLLDYQGDDPESDRETFETAFRQLERAFAYDQSEGLLFTVGYSPAYFKEHRRGPPRQVDISEPEAVSPYADPDLDRQDLFVHLGSDSATVVLAAELLLMGEVDEVNGVSVDASLSDVCVKERRRSVFVGPGEPAERIDNDNIDEEAPLSMGFDSAYADSIPHEDQITIESGPWAGGTVAQVSKLRLRLDEWYERDAEQRVDEMWAGDFDVADVGDHGEELGKGSGITEEDVANIEEHATQEGVAGHAAKVARARDDDFVPTLLRRDGDITTDGGDGGLSFVGLVEGISDWMEVAEAMYDPEIDDLLGETDDDHHDNSGIAAQMDVRARGNFLIPPRSLRALPTSQR